MEPLVLIVGFACFGGLLSGYSVARLCPAWMLWTLWGVGIIAAGVTAILPVSQSETGGLIGAIILYGAIIPFTGCAFVAGLIGLIARRTTDRSA